MNYYYVVIKKDHERPDISMHFTKSPYQALSNRAKLDPLILPFLGRKLHRQWSPAVGWRSGGVSMHAHTLRLGQYIVAVFRGYRPIKTTNKANK